MTIATVVSITGQAWARDADGNLRELSVGDALQEGETLVTSDGGRAVLDFGDGLEPAAIAGGEEVVMTPDLASDQAPASEEASAQDGDIAALLAAIDEGEGDLLEGLDATAAGGAGGAGGGDSGHGFVRLLRISENVSPLVFNYGANSLEGPNQVEFDPALVAEEDDSPTVDTQDLNGDGDVVWESALSDGSGGGSLTASGAFQIDTGVDALDLIEVQDASGVWIPISANGTSVQGAYGTLTVNTDGSWTYTLDDNTLDHDGVDQTGAADQVQDAFAVRVTDDDGDVSPEATLTIDVNDDGPVAVDDTVTDEVPEDGSVDIDVFANDTAGADGVDLQSGVGVASQPGKGTVTYNGDGTFTYQANPGAEGADSFTYTITDADGDTDTATVNLTIAEDSTPQVVTLGIRAEGNMVWESALPDGSGGGTTTISGTPEIDTGNDQLALIEVKDVNGEWIAIEEDGTEVQGTYGIVTVDTDGSWQYVLSDNTLDHDVSNAVGTNDQVQEQFDVRFTDDDGDVSDPATLTIDVNDDGPVAADYAHGDTVTEGSGDTVLAADAAATLGIDGGADGLDGALDALVFTNQGSTGGSLTINAAGELVYTAPADVDNSAGAVTETFEYTVTDNDGDSVTREVSVQVGDAGAPTLTASDDLLADEDDQAAGLGDSAAGDDAPVLSGTLSFDNSSSLDAFDLDTLTLSVGTDGDTGLTTLDGSAVTTTWDASTQTLIGHTGDVNDPVFTIVISDLGATGATYTLTLMQPVAHPAQDDPDTGDVETAFEDNVGFTVDVSLEDIDGSEGTTSFAVSIDDDVPVAADYAHGDTVTEGSGDTVLAADAAATLGIDGGADGLDGALDALVFTNQGSTGGSLTINAAGELVYTAPADVDNSAGAVTETFEYTVTDNDGDSVTREVSVQVGDAGAPTLTASDDLLADEDDQAAGLGDSAAGDDAPVLSGTLSFDNSSSLDAFDLDTLTLSVGTDGDTGLTTLDGSAVTTTWDASTQTLIGHTGDVNDPVFTIVISDLGATGATYTLTLMQPVAHPAQDDPDTGDVETAFEDNVGFTVDVSLEDIDGSEGTTSFAVSIDDDVPVAADYAHGDTVTEGSGDTVLAADAAATLGIDGGADGLDGALDALVFTNQGSTGGSLTINAAGELVYTAPADVDNSAGAVTETFEYTVTDNDGDSVTREVSVQVGDAGAPTLTASDDLLADEDDQAAGLGDSAAGDDAPVLSGTLSFDNSSSLDAFDLDTLTLSVGTDGDTGLTTLDGSAVTTTWDASTQTLIGHTGDVNDPVFTIVISDLGATGATYTLTLMQPVAHPAQDDPDTGDVETAFEDNVGFTVDVSLEDIDGSEGTTSFAVSIDDDVPVAFTASSADLSDGATAALNFAAASGADGVGDVTFAQSLNDEPAVDSAGKSLYLDGEPLFYTVSADGHLLTAATEGGDVGFTVTLDPGSDSYTVAVEGLVLNGSLFSANPAGGVSGGNSLLYLINSEDGIEGNDVLVSSTTTDTVNTSTGGGIGIGTGQSIDTGELARFDFFSGLAFAANNEDAVWDDRLLVYGVEQRVNVNGNAQSAATLEISAVATAEAASGEHPSSGSDTYLNLSVDDVRIYDANGGDVTSSVTLTDMGDGIRVEGVKDGWSYEVMTDSAFHAIEVVGGDGDEFKLGGMDFLTGGTAGSFDINLDVTAVDGDGDAVTGSITLESPEPPVLEVGGNVENSLSGNAGDDVLIGDTGGNYTVITPGESYNISLLVDSSGSMGEDSGTDGKSRMELAQDALKLLAQQLLNHDGAINLQIIDFDSGVTSTVFTNITIDDLADIEAAINAMVAGGGTNYEAGFNAATAWLDSHTNGYVNKALFLTDGDPTYYLRDDGTRDGNGSSTTETVMRESIEAFGLLANAGDNGTQVEAIGIGSGVSADRLQFFDNTDVTGMEEYWPGFWWFSGPEAAAGEATIVNTADELNAALQGGSSSNELAPVGNDTLIGGDGDDILFGDTIAPVGQPEAGFGGVIDLVKDANGGASPTYQQIIDFLRDNPEAYETPADQGGDDLLVGGAGDDILTGGLGADVFAWNLGDEGSSATPAEDTVTDFTTGIFGTDANADKLDLSDLLSGMQDGEDLSSYIQATDDGTNTTLHISTSGDMTSGDVSAADQTIQLQNVVTSVSDLQNNGQLDIE
ncbi:retention module-containing protein [Halomonas halophila]|uniref:retention module-containing protein n=1 Tax=Halomonas halophila TaxID=29573 RepID=UPI0036329259